MQQHELLSKYTVDQFLSLIAAMEGSGDLEFSSDSVHDDFVHETLRLFQHDLRVGVSAERDRWMRLMTAQSDQ